MNNNFLLKGVNVYTRSGLQLRDVMISSGNVFVNSIDSLNIDSTVSVIDCRDMVLVPGFTDVHVHFREPGFFYKETIRTGTMAAARGGYTCVCTMPNLNPPPGTLKALQVQLDIIEKSSLIRTVPYGTITINQDGQSTLSQMSEMAPYVCGFSDDGKGVQTGDLMESAMVEAKRLGKVIAAHCEDESLLNGGYIHRGKYAEDHGHRGICSESEWVQVERDVTLAEKTGCSYHVCHVSSKESVGIIRKAKLRGVDVSCETAPHYLTLSDSDIEEDGRFKMNPPLRDKTDKDALIEGIIDGTIDIIATDHAPHSCEEKSKGLSGSAFGIVGLETAFPVLYTELVKKGVITFDKLVQLMSVNPRRRFGLPGGEISQGATADVTLLDLNSEFKIDSDRFLSMGKSTPFDGWNVYGQVVATFVGGKKVWQNYDVETKSKSKFKY